MPQGLLDHRTIPFPVGAGMPANTGKAGAIHRVACFAGAPAPTGHATTPPFFFSQQEHPNA
jgi:hypothetical protein